MTVLFAAGRREVEAGEDRGEGLREIGVLPQLARHRPNQRRDERAHESEPDPPRERAWHLLAERPADRPADTKDRGWEAGQREAGGDPEVTTHEELDPDREEDDSNDPHEPEWQPVVPADQGDVVGRPAERAQDHDATDVQTVGDPQDEHDEAGDARRAGATEEGRQGERETAEEHGEEAAPESEADGG